VADLATFLLITIFPQTPFVLYFAYIQPVIFPVDPIVGTLMLLYLVSLIWHNFTMGNTAQHCTHQQPHFANINCICAIDLPFLRRVASAAADHSQPNGPIYAAVRK